MVSYKIGARHLTAPKIPQGLQGRVVIANQGVAHELDAMSEDQQPLW
jgi:hypothetical protein